MRLMFFLWLIFFCVLGGCKWFKNTRNAVADHTDLDISLDYVYTTPDGEQHEIPIIDLNDVDEWIRVNEPVGMTEKQVEAGLQKLRNS